MNDQQTLLMQNICNIISSVKNDTKTTISLLNHLKRIVNFSIKERTRISKKKIPIREKILGQTPRLPFRPRTLIHQRAEIKKKAIEKNRLKRQQNKMKVIATSRGTSLM
jgi:hypothetical protein